MTETENGDGGKTKITANTWVNVGLLAVLLGATWTFLRQQSSDAAAWRAEIADKYMTKEKFDTWADGFERLMELRFENLKDEIRRGATQTTPVQD